MTKRYDYDRDKGMLPGKIKTASLLVKISFCFTLLYNTDKYHHISHSSDGSRLEQLSRFAQNVTELRAKRN